jgi:hypothetical protein
MVPWGSRRDTVISPQVREMVLIGLHAGHITRVIGSINGHWWVQTSAAPYGVVQGILHDWGNECLWAPARMEDELHRSGTLGLFAQYPFAKETAVARDSVHWDSLQRIGPTQ